MKESKSRVFVSRTEEDRLREQRIKKLIEDKERIRRINEEQERRLRLVTYSTYLLIF